MQLITFGKVGLTGCAFSRPKPLLLLAYLALEGPQGRRRLASLLWRGENDRGNLQKKLAKLSVVLTQFKKEGAGEVFPDALGLDPLITVVGCDVTDFLTRLEAGDQTGAVALYGGAFMESLDSSPAKLELSGELQDWLLVTREGLAQKAQEAMLELAEGALRAQRARDARDLAERAYALPAAPEPEPRVLSRIQEVLLQTGSNLAKISSQRGETSLEDLPPDVRSVFLALALQEVPNLSVVRGALKLSLSGVSEALEWLIEAGLVLPNGQLLAPDLARHWLEAHPRDAFPLTLALARAAPTEGAFRFYGKVYQQTKGLGGIGDLPRARAAYGHQARTLNDKLDYDKSLAVLGELRDAEQALGVEPLPESQFLEAYALERTGRYSEALGRVEDIPEEDRTPDVTALMSVLLWRRGKGGKAKVLAEGVRASGPDWLWARATAHNTLGYLAYDSEAYDEASSYFKKAASLFQASGNSSRYVGSLNNHANALDTRAEAEERRGADAAHVSRLRDEAAKVYRSALDVLEENGSDPALRARILLNVGMLWEYQKDWDKAEEYYLDALYLAENLTNLELAAKLHKNLGNAHFMRGQLVEARRHHRQAIGLAAKAGDFFTQGMAAANLANLDNDPDGMEVALELLEESGEQGRLAFFQEGYEEILRIRLREALEQDNGSRAELLFARLGTLYQKWGKADRARAVATAQIALAHTSDPQQQRTLLLSFVQNENAGGAGLPN